MGSRSFSFSCDLSYAEDWVCRIPEIGPDGAVQLQEEDEGSPARAPETAGSEQPGVDGGVGDRLIIHHSSIVERIASIARCSNQRTARRVTPFPHGPHGPHGPHPVDPVALGASAAVSLRFYVCL